MIDALFASSTYTSSKELLDMTSARHEAIASNIANVHTPGYQRVDVAESFMQKLESAIAEGDVEKLRGLGAPGIKKAEGFEAQRSDGNNVNLDKEMMFLAENSFAFNMNAQMVSSSLRRLETAITGRVS